VSGFLLDTNLISELVRPKPDLKVRTWVAGIEENLLYLSVLTLGEIRRGISMLRDGARRIALEAWLDGDLIVRFANRVLGIDREIADRWGRLTAQASRKAPLAVIDGLLAATALHHNLIFVTRNTKDLEETGVPVFNPWRS
jgi:toxin FitB